MPIVFRGIVNVGNLTASQFLPFFFCAYHSLGVQGEDEDISESECMYRYLIDKGIEPERLYKEDKSTSTRENLKFSRKIIERELLNKQVAIATNEFHEYRAKKIAKSLGLESSAIPGATEIWVFPTHYVRELFSTLYEWVV